MGEDEGSAAEHDLRFSHLETVQNGFALGDEVHALVLHFDDIEQLEARSRDIQALVPAGAILRPWQELLPEVVQGIELDVSDAQHLAECAGGGGLAGAARAHDRNACEVRQGVEGRSAHRSAWVARVLS